MKIPKKKKKRLTISDFSVKVWNTWSQTTNLFWLSPKGLFYKAIEVLKKYNCRSPPKERFIYLKITHFKVRCELQETWNCFTCLLFRIEFQRKRKGKEEEEKELRRRKGFCCCWNGGEIEKTHNYLHRNHKQCSRKISLW